MNIPDLEPYATQNSRGQKIYYEPFKGHNISIRELDDGRISVLMFKNGEKYPPVWWDYRSRTEAAVLAAREKAKASI